MEEFDFLLNNWVTFCRFHYTNYVITQY